MLSSNKFHCLSLDIRSSVLDLVRPRYLIRSLTSFWFGKYGLLSSTHLGKFNLDLQYLPRCLTCCCLLKMADPSSGEWEQAARGSVILGQWKNEYLDKRFEAHSCQCRRLVGSTMQKLQLLLEWSVGCGQIREMAN